MTQLYSSLWGCRGRDRYPPIVFELLRLLTEDFRELRLPGIYYALPYIAHAIGKSAGAKRAADVWLIITAYMQIRTMCRSVFGELQVDDLSSLLAQTLGGDNPQPDHIVLGAVGQVIEAVQADKTEDHIRQRLTEALGEQVICIGSKYLATTREWMYLIMIDVEERKIWRFHKDLAEKADWTNWPRAVDLRIRSPMAEWPSITMKNPGIDAEMWWKYWVLKEGEDVT